MSNPLRHIDDAKRMIEQRRKGRAKDQLDHRSVDAAEDIADELALIRAEMTTIRELVESISAKTVR
jgi:hypothetical protein